MKTKTDVSVEINGKKYVICGDESEEYLQTVATYINETIQKLKSQPGYNSLDTDMKNVLLQINMADEYIKAMTQIKELVADREAIHKENFELKHEKISLQTKREELQKRYDYLQLENHEAQKRIVELQSKLDEYRYNK